MDISNRPLVTSTTLSTLVHGVVFLSLLLVMEQSSPLGEDAAREIMLELIGSEVEQVQSPQQESNLEQVLNESMDQEKVSTRVPAMQHEANEAVPVIKDRLLTSEHSDVIVADSEKAAAVEVVTAVSQSTAIPPVNVQAVNAQAVDDRLIELLHSRISDKKQYPYFAKRQRREGVATVSFVLHPNGDIEDARLVNSSRTELLDRAALTAVEKIEPFEVAQDYLETAETFNIDVVFELL